MAQEKPFKIKSGLSMGKGIALVDDAVPADGQILIGNTASGDMQLGTITQGLGITVSNAAGAITIAMTAAAVAKAGDTMTGFLTLSADPTLANHAATKNYVDVAVSSVSGGSAEASATYALFLTGVI